MSVDKSLLSGSTAILILKLLEGKDMYGYQMIEELSQKTQNVFDLKAGTLYPLLHSLEQKGLLSAYDQNADAARVRRYYSLTDKGRKALKEKQTEWKAYEHAMNRVLGGAEYGAL